MATYTFLLGRYSVVQKFWGRRCCRSRLQALAAVPAAGIPPSRGVLSGAAANACNPPTAPAKYGASGCHVISAQDRITE